MIELIVTVIVLGILAGIATASYASVFSKGQDSTSQDALHALSVEQQSYFSTYGAFANSSSTLAAIEPNYTFFSSASTGPTSVSFATGTVSGTAAVGMAILGASGYCNTINVEDPTQSRNDLTGRFLPSSGSPCTGAYALSNTSPVNPW
jgi:Tfp pilus assembly protein PilE